MGASGFSKSQASRPCQKTDERVFAFRSQPIKGDWPCLWLDATYLKSHVVGRVANRAPISSDLSFSVDARYWPANRRFDQEAYRPQNDNSLNCESAGRITFMNREKRRLFPYTKAQKIGCLANQTRENALGNLKNFRVVLLFLTFAPGGLYGGELTSALSPPSGRASIDDSRVESGPTVSATPLGSRIMLRDKDGHDRITAHLSLSEEQALIWNVAASTEPRRRSPYDIIMTVISYVAIPFFLSMGYVSFLLIRARNRRVILGNIVGIDEIEGELREIVDFLRDPRKFTRFNDETPKGVMLVNPAFKVAYESGAGPSVNSTLAHAIANEARVPFYRITNPGFMKRLANPDPDNSLVQDVFQRARKNAPCIVYIDDITDFKFGNAPAKGFGNDRRRRKLNRILEEMRTSETIEGIVVFAATDRPEALDPALLSPRCFGRQMKIPMYRYKWTHGYTIFAMLALVAFLLPLIMVYYNCADADAPFFMPRNHFCNFFRWGP